MCPTPSKNIRPAAENTLALLTPDTRDPSGVLLKVAAVVVAPLVPCGVAATGTKGPDPSTPFEPGGVAPSKKNPALDPVNPYEPAHPPSARNCGNKHPTPGDPSWWI